MSHEDSRHREVAPPVAPRACPRARPATLPPNHSACCSVSGTRAVNTPSSVPKGCASESTLLPSHVPRTNLTSARPSLMSLRTFPVETWPHGRRLPPQTQDLTVENLPEAILEGRLLASFHVVSLGQPPRVSHQPRPCGHGGVHRHGETSFQFEPQTPDLSIYSILRSSHRADALAAEPWRRLNLELKAVRTCPQRDPVCQCVQRRLGGHLHDCLHMGHPFDERSAERREVRTLVGFRGQRRAHWFLWRHPRLVPTLGVSRTLASSHFPLVAGDAALHDLFPSRTRHTEPGDSSAEVSTGASRCRARSRKPGFVSLLKFPPGLCGDETRPKLSFRAPHWRTERPQSLSHVIDVAAAREATFTKSLSQLSRFVPRGRKFTHFLVEPRSWSDLCRRRWCWRVGLFHHSTSTGATNACGAASLAFQVIWVLVFLKERAKVLPFTCTGTFRSPPPVWRSTHEPSSLNFISAPFLVSVPTLRRDLLTSLCTNGV